MPEPVIEKAKQLKTYDNSVEEEAAEDGALTEIIPGHFVYMNESQRAGYEAKLREMQELEKKSAE